MADNARQIVTARLSELKWSKAQLAREADVDPGTVGAFLAGRRMPNSATLGRLGGALGLTPGTLEGSGEEPFRLGQSALDGPDGLSVDLSAATDSELTSELTYRIEKLRREVAELTRQLRDGSEAIERERRRASRRLGFIESIDENSPDDLREAKEAWVVLMHDRSALGTGWKSEDARAFEGLCDTFDALAWAEDQELVIVDRTGVSEAEKNLDPTPSGADNVTKLTSKHQRMIEEALQIDRAAYDGEGQGEE